MELASTGAAVGAAVCYGIGSVLQARGARGVERAHGVDPRLLVRVLGSLPFVVGIGLDTVGFVLQLLALRTLPLFLVQTAVASSLAVTAVGAALWLRDRLGTREWTAVAAVCVGLALLGFSAGAEGHHVPSGLYIGLILTLGVLAAWAVVLRWLPGRSRAAGLGAAAGLAFGVVALATRALPSLALSRLLVEPATYLVAAGGVFGFLFYATALQAGSVTAATASLVVGETLVPAVLGILVFGDRARPGTFWLALVGFLLAVVGALALSRFGEPERL